RMGRRCVPRQGRSRQSTDDPRSGHVAPARPIAPEGRRTHLGGDGRLRPTQLHVAGGDACLRGGGRYRDGPDRRPAIRGRRRLRRRDQPHDRGWAGAGRRRAGHRGSAVRGGCLRRVREPHDLVDDPVPDPFRDGDPGHDLGSHGNAVDGERLGREGHRRSGNDRLAAGGDQRGRGRPVAPRRDRDGQAGVPRTRVESDPGSNQEVAWSERWSWGSDPGTARGRCVVIPAPFEYARAGSVEEAISLLGSDPDAKILAGGHSLLPAMRLRVARPSMLVDIGRIADLSYVREDGDRLAIGALTRHHDVANAEALQELCPIVAHAAGQIGDPQVRHMGTIGGSVAHGDPAGDLPAVLLALDAEFVAQGPNGIRTVAATDFFTSLFETALAPDEVLTEIRIPKANAGWSFMKFQRRGPGWGGGGGFARPRTRRGA